MSATEVLVVGFGLFIGYWIVSKLLVDRTQGHPRASSSGERTDTAPVAPWHQVLEISPQASVEEIRDAYTKLMRQYKPDNLASLGHELQTAAARRSREITEAYRTAMRLRGEEA